VAPHLPLTVPQEFYDLYPHDRIPRPNHYPEDERSQHPVIQALMRVWNYDDFFDRPKLLRARAGYYGLISFLDHSIGKVLAALEDSGQRNETVIVYTADHGEMLGNMLRQGRWKYTYYVGHQPELYDLATEPLEGRDLGLSPAHAGIRAALEAALRRIVDPEAADARAFADQAATIERHGGVEVLRRRGHPSEHSMDRRLGVE
jgi:arylsulfatase A-like enzyme